MKTNFDLVIVGGGILGAATAFFASRAGLSVALVEKRASLAAHTTSKAVSCFRAQWEDPDFFYLMKNSIDVYENFSEITGLRDYDIGLRQQGWIFASTRADAPDRFKDWIEGQRALGLADTELLDGDEARRRFPFLSGEITAATFRARDGWLSPYEAAVGFVRASKAEQRLDTTVTRIVLKAGRVAGIDTTRGALDSGQVAICAGPHSRQFAESLGIPLPVKLLRRQRAFVSTRGEIPGAAPMVADHDTGAYWRPESGGAFLGLALDEAPQPPLDEVAGDHDFAALVVHACSRLSPFWREVGSGLRANQVRVAAGQYSITPDGKPLIGGVQSIPGLYFLTGDNGYGIEGGPQAARHLVGLITGTCTEQENPFHLDREMNPGRKLVL